MQRPPLGICARATADRCIDGDTLAVTLHIPVVIRLDGCWAAESRTKDAAEKKKGLAAKQNLSELTANESCHVFIPTGEAHSLADVFTFGRVVAKVWMDGQVNDLSTLQVLAGHATATKAG